MSVYTHSPTTYEQFHPDMTTTTTAMFKKDDDNNTNTTNATTATTSRSTLVPRVAILVSGEHFAEDDARAWALTRPRIMYTTAMANADVFVALHDRERKATHVSVESTYHPMRSVLVQERDFDHAIFSHDWAPAVARHRSMVMEHLCRGIYVPPEVWMRQYVWMQVAWRLMEEEEAARGGIRYDVVVRMRPNVILNHDVHLALLNTEDRNAVYTCIDWLQCGPRASMEWLCMFMLPRMYTYYQADVDAGFGHPGCSEEEERGKWRMAPETQMAYHIRMHCNEVCLHTEHAPEALRPFSIQLARREIYPPLSRENPTGAFTGGPWGCPWRDTHRRAVANEAKARLARGLAVRSPPMPRIAALLHVGTTSPSECDEYLECLARVIAGAGADEDELLWARLSMDVYVTLCEDVPWYDTLAATIRTRLRNVYGQVFIVPMPNRGLDAGGFILACAHAVAEERHARGGTTYLTLLKLHCKTRRGQEPPERLEARLEWRAALLSSLVGSVAQARACVQRVNSLNGSRVGMVGPHRYLYVERSGFEASRTLEQVYADILPVRVRGNNYLVPSDDHPITFVAGSMFWARAEPLLAGFRSGLRANDEEAHGLEIVRRMPKGYPPGETDAHGWERAYGAIVEAHGLCVDAAPIAAE